MTIYVPSDCLPSSVSECRLVLTAHLNTEITLPSQASLVSGAYDLTLIPNIQQLNKPVELVVEHCGSVMSSQESHLSFVVARKKIPNEI